MRKLWFASIRIGSKTKSLNRESVGSVPFIFDGVVVIFQGGLGSGVEAIQFSSFNRTISLEMAGWLEMAGDGWGWLEMAGCLEMGMAGDGCGDGWRWLGMAGDGCRWLGMAGDGWRWLEIAGDGWGLLEMAGDG